MVSTRNTARHIHSPVDTKDPRILQLRDLLLRPTFPRCFDIKFCKCRNRYRQRYRQGCHATRCESDWLGCRESCKQWCWPSSRRHGAACYPGGSGCRIDVKNGKVSGPVRCHIPSPLLPSRTRLLPFPLLYLGRFDLLHDGDLIHTFIGLLFLYLFLWTTFLFLFLSLRFGRIGCYWM